MKITKVTAGLLTLCLALSGVAYVSAQMNQDGLGLRLPTGYGSAQTATPPPQPDQPAATPAPQGEQWVFVQYNDINPDTIPEGPYDNIWGIFIGVSQYETISNLTNADRDARVLSQTMVDTVGLKEPIVLVNQNATIDRLVDAMEELAPKVGSNDLVVFHFSGHGIGLRETLSGRMNGFLMLHEAAFDTSRGAGPGPGMLDMSTLDKYMNDAGIDSKHKLLVLDCCFSGFGALTRSVITTDSTRAVRNMLNRPATYLMAAGDAGQEVLDLSVDFEGHGLLTGLLIQTLQTPQALSQFVTPIRYEGRYYLDTVEIHQASRRIIPDRAYNTLDAVFADLQRELFPNSEIQELADANEARFLQRVPEDARDFAEQIFELNRQLQNPQARLSSGSGGVLLPIAAPGAETPTPTSTPTPSPTAAPGPSPTPTVTPTTTPTPEPRPSTPDSERMGQWRQWAEEAGRHWGDPDYGRKIANLFEFIYEKSPPSSGSNEEIAVAAEVLARPIISTSTWRQVERVEGWDRYYQTDPARVFANREQWRQRYGLSWNVMPYRGASLSENYEYSFRLFNPERDNLYYYLIAIDTAGNVQWIAPENRTWVDSYGNYSSGISPLTPNNALYQFPPPHPQTGATAGQSVLGTNDQYFFLLMTRAPWRELEEALTEASSRSFELYFSNPRAANTPVGTRDTQPVAMTRAVGRVNYEKIEAGPSTGNLDTVARTRDNFLVFMWKIDIVPGDVLQPELGPRETANR
ncbi:MAG: caspase family protein [Candidatus Sumerlaeia bacterium]|nr:caspase family protein [Candidatus Sumerlaeia bacterium]